MHPTVKPIAMVSDAILDVTRRRDIILDPFCGSGTTILAAERTGRRAYAIELDPGYVDTLEELARLCRARNGSLGAFIEDKNSGTILLQQARRRGLQAREIESRLTAMGKDERAISVSGYVHQGLIKYSDRAFNKTVVYKQRSRNHLAPAPHHSCACGAASR
jgi:adenine-specific DNA methylase